MIEMLLLLYAVLLFYGAVASIFGAVLLRAPVMFFFFYAVFIYVLAVYGPETYTVIVLTAGAFLSALLGPRYVKMND